MNRIWKFLRSLDWRVLLAVPVLSVLLGVANNLRVSVDQRVRWSGEPIQDVEVAASKVGAQPGAWTSDFTAATNAAMAAHVPVVVVVTQKGCQYCSRLHQALNGVAVKAWQRERGWYFVMAEREKHPDVADFVVSTPVTNTIAPYVGVYWTRADGTQVMRNFSGRQGNMGVEREKTLAFEWIRAVETSVPRAPGIEGGTSVAAIMREAKMRVAVATDPEEGAAGRVKMSPQVNFVKEGQKVTLTAEPMPGSVFMGWRYPNGRVVRESNRLVVGSSHPEGTYTALFRQAKYCAAPILHLPEQEVVWKSGERVRLSLRVNEDANPVAFSCTCLPPGVKLVSRATGVISGKPMMLGVWRVAVTVKGVGRTQPAAKGAFTIRVRPRDPSENDDGADKDDDDADKDDKVD